MQPRSLAATRLALSDLMETRPETITGARAKARILPDARARHEGGTSPEGCGGKWAVTQKEADLKGYCRRRSIYPVQLPAWRTAYKQVNGWKRMALSGATPETKRDKKRIQQLEWILRTTRRRRPSLWHRTANSIFSATRVPAGHEHHGARLCS